MKKVSFLIAILLLLGRGEAAFFGSKNSQENNQNLSKIQWYMNYEEAKAEAKKMHKPLFLFFTGSDWCGWCKKMEKEIFSSSSFIQEVGRQFIFVELDFPMKKTLPENITKQNAALKQKYGISGFPTVIILSPQENFIAEMGYRSGGGEAYAKSLKELLRNE